MRESGKEASNAAKGVGSKVCQVRGDLGSEVVEPGRKREPARAGRAHEPGKDNFSISRQGRD